MGITCQSTVRHLAFAGIALASSTHGQTSAPSPRSAGVEPTAGKVAKLDGNLGTLGVGLVGRF